MEGSSGPMRAPRNTPLAIGVSGLPGAGVTTLCTALAERFGVHAAVDGDGDPPDLVIRVIGAQVRSRDREAIDAAPTPMIVVAGKADARSDSGRLAEAAVRQLGRPVFPVSGLLAGVRLDDSDIAVLRRWQQAGVRVPRAAAAFVGDDPVDPDRAGMIARLGRVGLVAAFEELAGRPLLGAAELTERLRSGSGVDALVDPIAGAAGRIAEGRRARRLHGLRLRAARGPDRAVVEHRLLVESLR